MKTTDLHIHSTYSDGTMSVEQLIKKAKETGLQNISITDHDTTEQIPDCIKLGKEYDLHVIPGVELSCSYTIRSHGKKQGIHLLGYGINPEDDTFQKVMAELRNKRLIRAKQISEKFIELGFKIDFENTLAKKKGSVERPEIARAVFYNPENKDMLKAEKIEDYPSFFNTYISDKGKAFVPREEKISLIDGIKLIHSAGGKAVWAHSYYNIREGKFNNPDLILDELLKDFIDAGLDGIETFYSTFSEEKTKRLYQIAKENNLIMTAGSDFHEPGDERAPELAYWKDYGLNFQLDERLG